MAEAMQGAMPPPPQMGNMAAEMAAVEEMRKQVSPSEVNNEMLMAAEQADPIAVAEFRRELEEMEIPPEVLALLNTMVDEVLSDPANYAAIRARYMAQGVDEELLPEAFDAQLFGALQVALDQLRAPDTMAPPQNFAKGGIAGLRPMAKAMADAGRNGDTMVAHISPIEAQILRRIGGSGTTNPTTGMPEFFLKKLFKKIGKTIKKFANTTIGKIVIGTALFMVAGPAATALFGSTAAPALIAATQGFVAGAGSSLIAGGNLKDSLKAGAIGAVTAGAVSGVTQGASAFKPTAAPTGAPVTTSVPTVDNTALPDLTTTARETVAAGTPMPGIDTAAIDQASQLASLTEPSAAQSFAAGPQGAAISRSAIPPAPSMQYGDPFAAPGAAVTRASPSLATAPTAVQSGVASLDRAAIDQASLAAKLREMGVSAGGTGNQVAATGVQTAPSSFFGNIKETFAPGDATLGERVESLKDAFSPSARQAAGQANKMQSIADKFYGGDVDALNAAVRNNRASAVVNDLVTNAFATNTISNYLPLAAAGMGIAGLSGAFSPEQPQLPPGYEDFMNAPGQRLLEQYPERYGLSFGGVNTMSQTAPYQMYRPYGAATGGSTSDFPRKNGHINGPGTGTSDDIPAMLSDGEFVFTAKAVRNMGNGSRRKGAKKMYALMKKLEGRANG